MQSTQHQQGNDTVFRQRAHRHRLLLHLRSEIVFVFISLPRLDRKGDGGNSTCRGLVYAEPPNLADALRVSSI